MTPSATPPINPPISPPIAAPIFSITTMKRSRPVSILLKKLSVNNCIKLPMATAAAPIIPITATRPAAPLAAAPTPPRYFPIVASAAVTGIKARMRIATCCIMETNLSSPVVILLMKSSGIKPISRPMIPTTTVMIPTTMAKDAAPFTADFGLRVFSIAPRTAVMAVNARSNTTNVPVIFIAVSGFGIYDSAVMTALKTMTTPSITIRFLAIPLSTFANFVEAIIIANIPIILDNAMVAAFKSSAGMNESPATTIANKLIARTIAIRLPLNPLLSLANFVTAIKPAKQASSITIAPRDLFRSSSSNLLRRYITPVSMSNAADMLKSIRPALVACCPANFETAITPMNRSSRTATTLRPFSISSSFMAATSFITLTMIRSAADIRISIVPALDAFSPANFDTAMTAANSSPI